MKIDDVQFNVELEDIIIELQLQLRANNINLIQRYNDTPFNIQVCCPYHNNGQERRPSAGIKKSDGIFHCFACGEVHTLPEMISYCFGYDDLGAFGWSWLLKNFITIQIEERKDVELDYGRSNDRHNVHGISNGNINFSRNGSNIERRFVSEEELDSYRYVHPYMYKRGLTDEVIEMFDIGYDVSTNCITFPIKDINGNCLFVARRSVVSKFFNYPEGAEKPLYGLYELYQQHKDHAIKDKNDITRGYSRSYNFTDVIVCESMLDALSFWTVGKYAVALNGLGNELQFKQLRELPCRKLILATDNDEAGMKARRRIRQNIKNKIITEYIFPKGRKDANECTKEELMNLEEVF